MLVSLHLFLGCSWGLSCQFIVSSQLRYLMGSHATMLKLVQIYREGFILSLVQIIFLWPQSSFALSYCCHIFSHIPSVQYSDSSLTHPQSKWNRRRNHWVKSAAVVLSVMLRCYHTTCSGAMLQDALTLILCGTGLWRIRTQRKLGVCWGISGRCNPDRLSLAVWCHSLPGRRIHTYIVNHDINLS